MAAAIEEAGFDIWLSDHVVLVDRPSSRYPHRDDGQFVLDCKSDWYEFLVTAAYVAAVTQTAEIGVGVAVAALRHPIGLAKQLATLDKLSGGRLRFGVGAGWLEEEFAALGVPFEARGARLNASLDLLRAAWTGTPPQGTFGPYEVPAGVQCYPTPARQIPIYIGGDSKAAIRRVVERGDGWLAMAPAGKLDLSIIERVREDIARLCAEKGRDPAEIEIAMRMAISNKLLNSDDIVDQLRRIRDVGVQRLIADIGWRDLEDSTRRLEVLASAATAAWGVPNEA